MNKLGNKKHKLHEIQKCIFKKFQDARNKRVNAHGSDLKRWAYIDIPFKDWALTPEF